MNNLLCEPFRFTQGWGSAGTVTVGVLAIAVSTIFNIVTLKRSAQTLKLAEETSKKTEDRYAADRLDARNEKLRSAVMDAAHKVGQVWAARANDQLVLNLRQKLMLESKAPDQKLMANAEAIIALMQGAMQSAIGDALSALDNAEFLATDDTIGPALQVLREAFEEAILEPETDAEMWADPEAFQLRVDEIRFHQLKVIRLSRRLVEIARETLTGGTDN